MLADLRLLLLDLAYPFLKWASGKHLPFTHKLVTGLDYYRVRALLKPGHIFVTKIHGELTSLIIPGYWSHAAIYTPQVLESIFEWVTEAEGPGVIRTDLVSFLLSKDAFMILEPIGIPDYVMELAADLAHRALGDAYDYKLQVSFGGDIPKAFYCSGLVWWAHDTACKQFKFPSTFVAKKQLGVFTVSPDDIANSGKFRVVYDSRGGLK